MKQRHYFTVVEKRKRNQQHSRGCFQPCEYCQGNNKYKNVAWQISALCWFHLFHPWPDMWLRSDITKLHSVTNCWSWALNKEGEKAQECRVDCSYTVSWVQQHTAFWNTQREMSQIYCCCFFFFLCLKNYNSSEVSLWKVQPITFSVNHSLGQIVNLARTKVQPDNKRGRRQGLQEGAGATLLKKDILQKRNLLYVWKLITSQDWTEMYVFPNRPSIFLNPPFR